MYEIHNTPEKPIWITKGLKEVLFIKSKIKNELHKWIERKYSIGHEWEYEYVIDRIIDTFLDEDARTKVEPCTKIKANVIPKVPDRNEEEYCYDLEDEDIEKGDILSFTNRCAENGCVLLRRCKNPDRNRYEDYKDEEYVYQRFKKINRLTPK